MSIKKILVIDDEQLILKSIQRALIKVGYSVAATSDRQSFMKELGKGPYDMVILDLNIKGITKNEIMKEAIKASPGVKFLIISGSNYDESSHFLQKPFKIEKLRKMVREILSSDQTT